MKELKSTLICLAIFIVFAANCYGTAMHMSGATTGHLSSDIATDLHAPTALEQWMIDQFTN